MAPRAGTAVLFVAALIAVLAAPSGVAAHTAADPGWAETNSITAKDTLVDGPIIIDTADESIDPTDPELVAEMERVHDDFAPGPSRRVAEPVLSWPQAAAVNSGMSVTYDSTHTAPPNVQAVVQAAAQKWDDALATTSAGPVQFAVIWKDLGSPGLLGSAGPNGLLSNPSELPTSSFYPVGLVNTLLATDKNGPSNPEVIVNLNSTPNWFIGTSGSPGPGQVDLFSVVLHEMGHGLGFLGSASLANSSGSGPALSSPPFIYDGSVTFDGHPLLDYSNSNDLLQSNNLWINLSASLAAKVYAPGSWEEGSSFSHLDENTYGPGQPGALMTPSLTTGEVERTLDAAVLSPLAESGWPMRALAVTPTISSVTASGTSVTAHWSMDLRKVGLAPDGHRVEAWRNGSIRDAVIDVAASIGQGTLSSLQPGATYELRVVPHANGIDGGAATAGFTTTGQPTAPPIVTASGTTLTQTISWTTPEGAGVTGYEVQRSGDGVNWAAIGSTSGSSVTVDVPAGVHQYRVRGSNAFGAGAWGYSIPSGASAGIGRPMALDGQIERLYRAYFLRDPDPSGFVHWRGNRATGAALVGIADVFAGSDEFIDTYGQLNDGQFVDLVYQNVLGRPPDSGGRAHWTGVLGAGGSRGSVMAGFSESSEFVSQTNTSAATTVAQAEVYRLYVAFFLRFPDAAGVQYWTGQRDGGASLETIAAAFAESAEFQNNYGALSNEAFVELVYNHVLARPADSAGRSFWLSQLDSGVNRGAMMVGFSESPEFIVASGTVP